MTADDAPMNLLEHKYRFEDKLGNTLCGFLLCVAGFTATVGHVGVTGLFLQVRPRCKDHPLPWSRQTLELAGKQQLLAQHGAVCVSVVEGIPHPHSVICSSGPAQARAEETTTGRNVHEGGWDSEGLIGTGVGLSGGWRSKVTLQESKDLSGTKTKMKLKI